jgi:2OG-Fe(II) oxygenase superfamily
MNIKVEETSSAALEKSKLEQQTVEDRLKAWYKIEERTWSSAEEVVPGSGIWVYRDVLPKSMNIIQRLEDVLQDSANNYNYQEAMVGYGMKMPEYRDCVDFKYKKSDIINDTSSAGLALQNLADEVNYKQLQAVKDYTRRYNIGELRYWEATNYVRYGEGQHFQEHHDHGYSYNCVVSLVSFPNDDYEGGELYFRLQNATIKAKAGETYIFPSNFMYPHRAMPVKSGIKYSMVTMLDFSEKFHNPKFYEETGS